MIVGYEFRRFSEVCNIYYTCSMGFKLAIHVGRRSGSQCFSATNFVSPMYDKRLHYLDGMKHSKYKGIPMAIT